MAIVGTRPGPNGRARPSLGDQLDRLGGILNGLSDALNESVTAAVTAAVGKAIREAVETAARELAARPAPPVAGMSEPEVTPQRRSRRRLMARSRAAARRTLATASRVTGRLFQQLGTPVIALVRRSMRAPGKFTALTLAGVVAGTAAGFGGPLIGAALGGFAGTAIAVRATPAG